MRRIVQFLGGRIGRKLMVMVGVVVAIGLVVLVVFYAQRQQESILAQHERTMTKVTESVIKGLRTVMLAGYAEIGHALFDRLRSTGEGMDIRILRVDGREAFQDNLTIDAVNERLGDDRFRRRTVGEVAVVYPSEDPRLRKTVSEMDSVSYRDPDDVFNLLVPVTSEPSCVKCHGNQEQVRGVLQVKTSLAAVREDIRGTWIQALVILVVALAGILFSINLLIRRTVVRPISRVTDAMLRAAGGDLTQQVPVVSRDELGQMAESFNHMIGSLLEMYSGLEQERNKLSTILLGAAEGIVVTNGRGQVVLINPSAEALLGKTPQQVAEGGFAGLFDDPSWVERHLDENTGKPELLNYGGRVLSVILATIRGEDGRQIGSAALMRDVTDETRLREELQRMSDTDALTGLYNRRYYDNKVADEFALAKRYHRPLSLFVFDVDHFKRFNDTYGHDQGDRVLQAMGKAMRDCAARTDVVCRYGGEEFVCIMPGADNPTAMAAAEKLRAHVEAMKVDGLSVTISIGVVTHPDVDLADAEAMLKAADTAMYAAKDSGRNRVCSALAVGGVEAA